MANRVYIGRLSSRASERDVEHFFRGYGRLRDIVLKNGFGFVEFESGRDADDAIYDLNGKELAGDRVVLEFSRRGPRGGAGDRYSDRGGGGGGGGGFPGDRSKTDLNGDRYGPPTKTRHRMIVENLSTRVSWQDLKDMARKYGEVTFADAHRDKKNEGVVCFATRDDLMRAVDRLDGKDINGRKLKCVDDSDEGRDRSRSRSRKRSRSPRSRSRSRSKSRSRSRSRSKSRSHSKSKSRSRSRDRSHSKSKSKSRSKSRTHSPSPKRVKKEESRERSASPAADNKSDKENSRSPSRSPKKEED